jgi:hypothetical protein
MTQPTTSTTSTTSLTAEQRTALALQRIEASRTRLILTLSPNGDRREKAQTPPGLARGAGKASTSPSFSASLAERMAQEGLGKGTWQALSGAATDWLRSQSWYSSVELVGSTLVHQARPVVHRHPWLCLGAAAAAGAALVALRPWGWQPVQHRMAPWRSQLGSLVWGQLTQAPVQMAIAGALAAWLSGAANTPPQASNDSPSPCPPPSPDTPHASDSPLMPEDPAPDPPSGSNDRAASSPGVMPAATIGAP